MNLFILSDNKRRSAIFHADRHIVKMPLETAQMLSFAYYHPDLWDGGIPPIIMGFSKTHDLHPCSKWIRESVENWKYAAEFGLELYEEYQYRYNQPDKHQRAFQIFHFALNNPPGLPSKGLTRFAEAMDDKFKISDCPITNYRNYYQNDKSHLFKWKMRQPPYWITLQQV